MTEFNIASFEKQCGFLYDVWQKIIQRLYPTLAPSMVALSSSKEPNIDLKKLNAHELYKVSHSLSTLFQLYNLAEEHYRYLRISSHRNDKAEAGTFAGSQFNEPLLTALKKINVRIVFTAHPTEARRPAVLRVWRRIAAILTKLDECAEGSESFKSTTLELEFEIENLLVTSDLRANQVTPIHEIRDLWTQVGSIWSASEKIYDRIHSVEPALSSVEHDDVTPLSFGCWVGSDADGNSNITPATMQYAAETLRRMALSRYLTACETILSNLTLSNGLLEIPSECRNWLAALEQKMPTAVERLGRRYKEEPLRRGMALICERLLDTLQQLPQDDSLYGYEVVRTAPNRTSAYPYNSSNEFAAEMEDVIHFHQLMLHSTNPPLERLLFQIRVFGFHYASLEHRLHAKDVMDVFRQIYVAPHTTDEEILTRIRGVALPSVPMDLQNVQDVLAIQRLLKVAELRRSFGAKAMDTIILSGTSRIEELLGLSLLATACGADMESAPIRIVPLFETLKDLENAPQFLDELFALPYWRQRLNKSNDTQEVMLGYSDSGKDAGILAANLALDWATKAIYEIGKKHKIRIEFFHGRGGTVARGGGYLYQSITASPYGVGSGTWKLTEQGEMIASRYGDLSLATRALEQMMVATMSAIERQGSEEVDSSLMETLSRQSSDAWRELIYRDDDFAKFFAMVSPVAELAALRMGSRPAKRNASVAISSLRAIPWNFAWLQNRLNITGWYGAGTALDSLRPDASQWQSFQNQLSRSPMLRLLLQKVRTSIWLSDWDSAQRYLAAVPAPYQYFIDKIRREYDLVLSCLAELERWIPAKPYAIFLASLSMRQTPLRGMAALQKELIDRFRHQSEISVEIFCQRALLQTFIGISAGVRNTG